MTRLVPSWTTGSRSTHFLMETWLPTVKMSIEATTWEGYREKIASYVLPRIGDVKLAELTAPMLNWLYADAREKGRIRGDEPLALKTVREIHVALHRALEDAVRWNYLRENPATRANPPSATAARNARKQAIRTWTAEQVEQFDDPDRRPPLLRTLAAGRVDRDAT